MLPFIRSDLAQLRAYTPHPSGVTTPAVEYDHLDTNECPFDLPDELKQKLAWTLQEQIASNRYPDGGHLELKTAIATYVNESLPAEAAITTANLSVGNGSDELIRSLLIATCLQQQGSILVADPTFSMYAILAKTLGIPVVAIGRSETDFQIDLVAAQAALEQTQSPPIRVVFMVHPNSPTANALTPQELAWLRQLPPEVLVVIDEAYFEFSQTTVASELPQHPNWVVLRTFSKAFRLAAHRMGYAIGHPELITALEKVRLPYNLPSVSQAAAQLALEHRRLLLEAIPVILQERLKVLEQLSVHPALRVWPSQANFVFVRLNLTQTSLSLEEVTQQLKQQGTIVRQINEGLRITIGSPEENDRTLARLAAILKA